MWLEVVDAAVDVMEIICVVGSSFTFTQTDRRTSMLH